MSGSAQNFKDQKNKFMSLCIDDDKLFEKYKTIWTNIEDLKNIEFNTLPVYNNIYMKNKIRTYGDKVYTNFSGSNVPKDGVECESITIISISFWLVYVKKYYLQVYINNCAYKVVNTQIAYYLDDNLFETDEN